MSRTRTIEVSEALEEYYQELEIEKKENELRKRFIQ